MERSVFCGRQCRFPTLAADTNNCIAKRRTCSSLEIFVAFNRILKSEGIVDAFRHVPAKDLTARGIIGVAEPASIRTAPANATWASSPNTKNRVEVGAQVWFGRPRRLKRPIIRKFLELNPLPGSPF
jgi:hypothetical protein